MIGLIDILKIEGFNPSLPSKIMRHQSSQNPVDELRERGWLELYQSYHGRPVLRNAKQVVSLYGLSGNRAGFYGVYHVLKERPASEGVVIRGCSVSEQWRSECKYYYELERDKRFDSLRDRIVVDWGSGARAWLQKMSNKPVLEVREPGRQLPPFDDYLEFSLSFDDLKHLYANENAHREWRARLSAVGGIYLVLAEITGHLYVGSAYGEEGIWGRWREYSKTGHGGNESLRELVMNDKAYPSCFRFSILQILPKTMARDEIVRRESVYKSKLGSRATGLNLN